MSLPVKKTKTVIIIVGPTASGKTGLSLRLASYFNTSIISADSRQCYNELNIGVAKPSEEALQSTRHYFINSHSILQDVNAQVFEEYALKSAAEIFKGNDTAIMVGGTGLYIQAFCEGFDAIPPVDASIREAILTSYGEYGLSWLQKELQKKDPVYWTQAEQKNPQRLMRALEVINATGKSILTFRRTEKAERPFRIVKAGIRLAKEQLSANIDARVDSMIRSGLVDETAALLPYRNLNALQTIGYKELFEFLDGNISLDDTVAAIKTNTKQYAKRQLTWFKKDASVKWMPFDDSIDNILEAYFSH